MTSPHRAAIGHPLTVAAAVLMLVNDLVLRTWTPGWLTGKLSDVGFLVVTPVLLAALVGAGAGHRGGRWVRGAAVAVTVAFYTTLQLWPPLGQLFSATHIADAEDLLVLPAVLLAFLCWRPAQWRWRVAFALPVLAVALVATQGDGWRDRTHPCVEDPEWDPNLPLLVYVRGANAEITDHFVRGIHLHEPDGAPPDLGDVQVRLLRDLCEGRSPREHGLRVGARSLARRLYQRDGFHARPDPARPVPHASG